MNLTSDGPYRTWIVEVRDPDSGRYADVFFRADLAAQLDDAAIMTRVGRAAEDAWFQLEDRKSREEGAG